MRPQNPVVAIVILFITLSFVHAIEIGSSPGFRCIQFSIGLCRLCIRTITVSAMVTAGNGTRNSIANAAADIVASVLQQQRFHEIGMYCVLHENTF